MLVHNLRIFESPTLDLFVQFISTFIYQLSYIGQEGQRDSGFYGDYYGDLASLHMVGKSRVLLL